MVEDKIYVVQTLQVIERCIFMTTDPGDLVLDPTCGSGTTAYVAEQWGRRWITIDTSRVALALARTRLMSARYPYYHLADDHPDLPPAATDEAIKTYFKNRPQMDADARRYEESNLYRRPSSLSADRSVRRCQKGFVYRRVPHITLKSIANNPEIDAIHDQWQPQLDALRDQINRAAGQAWAEWQVPREAGEKGRGGAGGEEAALLARWWQVQAGAAGGDRRRHRPPRRHRNPLRPALRGQQAPARRRAVHRRKPLAPPDDRSAD